MLPIQEVLSLSLSVSLFLSPLFQSNIFFYNNSTDQNALYCACRNGKTEAVILLLNEPAIQLNFQVKQHGGTYLHGIFFLNK